MFLCGVTRVLAAHGFGRASRRGATRRGAGDMQAATVAEGGVVAVCGTTTSPLRGGGGGGGMCASVTERGVLVVGGL